MLYYRVGIGRWLIESRDVEYADTIDVEKGAREYGKDGSDRRT